MLSKLGGETSVRNQRSSDPQQLSPAAAMIRRHDRDRFQTALFAPAAHREALFALYAFNYQIARVREAVTQPMLGHIRLEWWRENIAAAYQNSAVRRNDIVEALTAAIRERKLTRVHFDRLIDAREADFDENPPASLAVLEAYAEETSSPLIYLALEALGAKDRAASEAGHHIGIAYALAGLLRALPSLTASGRPIIPADIAGAGGLDFGDHQGLRNSSTLCAAVAKIAAAAEGHLRAARERRGTVRRAALPALLPAVVAGRALKRLKRAGNDPFAPALARPDPLQSWRLAAAALRSRF
jgi:NADH dehydrogenase [ubiquinone] 1 alpha subcomplex assembly factor 6